MARISIKKLILRDEEVVNILTQMIERSGEEMAITDEKNNLILGSDIAVNRVHENIEFEGLKIGTIYGSDAAKPMAEFVRFLIKREDERRKLGAEILDLYGEVNLMYNFTQKLADTIDQKGIAQLTLAEANTFIKADGGFVIFINEDNKEAEIIANSGLELIN